MARRKIDCSVKRKLAENEGTIWLEMSAEDATAQDMSPDKITSHLIKTAKKIKLGKYDGSSEGKGAFDVSFHVKNREATAVLLRKVMKEKFPSIRYSLSDEYEGAFESETSEESLSAQLENLERMAGFLMAGISGIRAQLAARGADAASQ